MLSCISIFTRSNCTEQTSIKHLHEWDTLMEAGKGWPQEAHDSLGPFSLVSPERKDTQKGNDILPITQLFLGVEFITPSTVFCRFLCLTRVCTDISQETRGLAVKSEQWLGRTRLEVSTASLQGKCCIRKKNSCSMVGLSTEEFLKCRVVWERKRFPQPHIWLQSPGQKEYNLFTHLYQSLKSQPSWETFLVS